MPKANLQATRRQIAMVTTLAVSISAFAFAFATPAQSALPTTSKPLLKLHHTIRTSPFAGSDVSVLDSEGSAYVRRDNSLWVADDNGRKLYELNATNGKLKRVIKHKKFMATPQLNGGSLAGPERDRDLEALAYNAATDTLYVFAGNKARSPAIPTVFRLSRKSGDLQLDSFQPLPPNSDSPAAAVNPRDGKIYVALYSDLRSYTYKTNTFGPKFQIPNVKNIYGMGFSRNGADLFLARLGSTLSRVNWARKALVPGWNFDLARFGIRDPRAVELINDRLFVSDGDDARTGSRRHAISVFDVLGARQDATASWTTPVASNGYPTRLRATLRSKTGSALGNRTVAVQMKQHGSRTWRTVGKATTARSGVATYRHSTSKAGSFRFSYARTATTSRAVFVKVPTRLSATAKTGRPDVVRGTLSKAAGSRIGSEQVKLQRKYAGQRRWVTVARVTSNRQGKVTSRQRPGRKSSFRWVYNGSTTNKSAMSKGVTVRR